MHLSDYKWFAAQPAGSDSSAALVVRRLGLQDYEPIFKSMRYLAEHPKPDRSDEIWLLSHKPVYTQGSGRQAGAHSEPGRYSCGAGGSRGPDYLSRSGQLVAYLLINVKRRKMGVRSLVDLIEQAIIKTLSDYEIEASTRPGAPGVYVNDAKIAALGLRIKNGWTYHGLSLNVNMDLSPFGNINPCGFEKLPITQVADLVTGEEELLQSVSRKLADALLQGLGYYPHYGLSASESS